MDLLNAVYEITLLLLARFFAHGDETDAQLEVLADVSVTLMQEALAPIGAMVAQLPIGDDHPGATAGPTFETFYAIDYLIPHQQAAWKLMAERLNEVAAFAVSCRNQCPPALVMELSVVAEGLRGQASKLAAAA